MEATSTRRSAASRATASSRNVPAAAAIALLAVPAVAIGVMIAAWAVNMPSWDEWEMVPVLAHLHAGHFVWADFWNQHNEHRVLFPTLLLAGLAQLDNWNIVVECLCSLAVAALSFALVVGTARRTRIASAGFLIVASVIWFSPAQWDNWLWGWQIEWFMNVLGLMAVVFVLAQLAGGTLRARSVALLIGGGVLAQFSLAGGTLVWPIALAVMVLMGAERRHVLAVVGAGAIALIANYWHYTSGDSQGPSQVLHHPTYYVHYVLNYLGSPLQIPGSATTAPIAGALVLVLFLAANALLVRLNRQAFVRMLPWSALGTYAIGNAIVTGVARVRFGSAQALASRYTTISSLLILATAALLLTLHRQLRGARTEWRVDLARAVPVIAVAGLALVLANWAEGIRSAHTRHVNLLGVAACTRAPSPSASCLMGTYPRADVVAPRLAYLKMRHWAGY